MAVEALYHQGDVVAAVRVEEEVLFANEWLIEEHLQSSFGANWIFASRVSWHHPQSKVADSKTFSQPVLEMRKRSRRRAVAWDSPDGV